MKTVVALTDPEDIDAAADSGADYIELRIDLFCAEPAALCERDDVPFIVTLRSSAEGGKFSGTPTEWWEIIEPWCSYATYIDIEQQFSEYAHEVRERGPRVIASLHLPDTPDTPTLRSHEQALRAYGDIPKIITTPHSKEELLRLLSFTAAASGPLCAGTMGPELRFGRVLAGLFGSEMVYCHFGTPTAEGQYHIKEMREIMHLLE
ncbi:type I 3-dehydroquinate dehydratase [Methanogenium organophilum]|uniref:3-dehydroquinate dehydratase n=1 Tax=Methanogenium organophilum TaxID=2199 RepID=A0A9X9S5Z0_METOG|nr:type I 3-dehydroquinate dehydratase [Methanogenium organophilum]WAI01520.1 type I 3-dehydroquinate dehydratase [Methanogenium organophilum]